MSKSDRFSVEIALKVKTADGQDFSSATLVYNDMSYESLVKIQSVALKMVNDLHKLADGSGE